ncbi:hypothetical protein FAGKG844_180008 [Frankia sp. AgKG'84/4]
MQLPTVTHVTAHADRRTGPAHLVY